jgi:hypothetical protein
VPSLKSFGGTSLQARRTYRESLYPQSVLKGQFPASDVAAFDQRKAAPGTELATREPPLPRQLSAAKAD